MLIYLLLCVNEFGVIAFKFDLNVVEFGQCIFAFRINPVKFTALWSHSDVNVVEIGAFWVAFDAFVDRLYAANPLELKIIEDFSEFEAEALDDENLSLEDTMTLLGQYVDSVETEADKDRLKTILKTLYVEAQDYAEQ